MARPDAFVLDPNLERILRLHWTVDPPYLRDVLTGDRFKAVLAANLKFTAEAAKLDAQKLNAHAAYLEAVGRQIG